MNQDLPEPDFSFDCDGTHCYYASTVRTLIAQEREACAKVCEQSDEEGEGPDSWGWHSKDFAKAIRARGNK